MQTARTVSRHPLRLSLLEKGEIERIHELSLHVLETTGIVLHYPPALDLLRAHGAPVDEGGRLARIPRDLVEQALKLAKRDFSICSQKRWAAGGS